MMPEIRKSLEVKRGCGYRQPGGLYLVSNGTGKPCGKLPVVLDICPTCGGGIKPARGWTWIDGCELLKGITCSDGDCVTCPISMMGDEFKRTGLLWIGEKYYKTPHDWMVEADTLGVSRRIPAVPREFVLGETWVFVAHRKTIVMVNDDGDMEFSPGVFHIFQPTAVEYIVTGDETEEELESLEKRGLSLVDVIRADETQPIFAEA